VKPLPSNSSPLVTSDETLQKEGAFFGKAESFTNPLIVSPLFFHPYPIFSDLRRFKSGLLRSSLFCQLPDMYVLGKSTQDKKVVLAIGLMAKSFFWKFNN
jgi:hypothetical protein